MRVALFTETFLPKVDGIVTTLCQLLQHLEKRGHESLLFAPDGAPDHFHSTAVHTYEGFPFPLYPELKLVPPMVRIRRHLAAFQPDVVHLIQPISLGLAGMWHARQLGIPVIASYHTDIAGFAAQWGLGWLQRPMWSFFRTIHQKADLNLCPSNPTLDQLREHRIPNVRLWTRGVDTQRFHPSWRSVAWRRRLTNDHPDDPLLLFVGRLSAEKRVDWLRPLLERFPNIRLAVVGDGPARDQLETLFAHTNTVFTGYLHGHDLAQVYASADLFTFPSPNETLGNVVLEAMASGLPIVAAAAGGPLDILTDNGSGLLFQPHSQADFIEKVGQLLTDAQLAARLGRQAREDVEGRDWDTVMDGLLDEYSQLAVKKRSASPTPYRTRILSFSKST